MVYLIVLWRTEIFPWCLVCTAHRVRAHWAVAFDHYAHAAHEDRDIINRILERNDLENRDPICPCVLSEAILGVNLHTGVRLKRIDVNALGVVPFTGICEAWSTLRDIGRSWVSAWIALDLGVDARRKARVA